MPVLSLRRVRVAAPKLPWLTALIEAYAILDRGVARALAVAARPPACHPGCQACCHQAIPVSTIEAQGLRWFALTHLAGGEALAVGRALCQGRESPCPFLVAGVCAVYPLRPMACREYVVFGRPCRPGERPDVERPGDLLPLPRTAQMQAMATLLPFYGIQGDQARREALKSRLLFRDSRLLQQLDWSGLAEVLLGK
jgi:hypothetical protein